MVILKRPCKYKYTCVILCNTQSRWAKTWWTWYHLYRLNSLSFSDVQEAPLQRKTPTYWQHYCCRTYRKVCSFSGIVWMPPHPVWGSLGPDKHRLRYLRPDNCRSGRRGHPSLHQPGGITPPAHQRAGHLGSGKHRRYCRLSALNLSLCYLLYF